MKLQLYPVQETQIDQVQETQIDPVIKLIDDFFKKPIDKNKNIDYNNYNNQEKR